MAQQNKVRVFPSGPESGPESGQMKEPKKGQVAQGGDKQGLIIGLLITNAIVMFAILAVALVATSQMIMERQSQETKDMMAMVEDMKDIAPRLKEMVKNPFGSIFKGALEANSDASRWRAVASKAADILDTMTKIDYTVPNGATGFSWDAKQSCYGYFEGNYVASERGKYDTDSTDACKNFNNFFNKNSVPGYGTCTWNERWSYCDSSPYPWAFRWIRQSFPGDIISSKTSSDLRDEFGKWKKIMSDFAQGASGEASGEELETTLESSDAVIDVPMWASGILDTIRPSLLESVIDLSKFLDERSFGRLFCNPQVDKSDSTSCDWIDKGIRTYNERTIKMVSHIVRIIAQNAQKIWPQTEKSEEKQ